MADQNDEEEPDDSESPEDQGGGAPETPIFPEPVELASTSEEQLRKIRLDTGRFPSLEHFAILEKIGEGGFGAVYRAEQLSPVERVVALKILGLMGTDTILSRFEGEKSALAKMEGHPNIATVYDAGETSCGRPYFAMELVRDSAAITDYCDAHQLPTRARLELFVKVCRAIQHAHQKRIVHRDIKPTNVLVTEHDGVPEPKIIDFGIARAIDEEGAGLTQDGTSPGTPIYMSPEQAKGELDVDTSSDIYALGNLLYELLVGSSPVATQASNLRDSEAVKRLIREECPRKPSAQFSSLAADERERVATARAADPAGYLGRLRGDLDWIVMKALQKESERRYATAAAFADDIVRHLEDQPVVAAPPSRVYLFKKFAIRHKVGFAVISGFTALLVAATLVSMSFAVKAERARAETALSQADSIAESAVVAGRRTNGLEVLAGATRLSEKAVEIRSIAAALLALGDVNISAGAPAGSGAVAKGKRADAITTDGLQSVITIVDADNGEELSKIQREEFPWIPVPEPGLLQFSPNEMELACAGPQTSMHLIVASTETGQLTRYFYTKDTLTAFAWHPSSELIVTGHDDAIVRFWDRSGGPLARLAGVEADLPPKLDLPVAANDVPLGALDGHRGEITAVACHPDGDIVATLDSTGLLRVWNEVLKGLAVANTITRPTLLTEIQLDGAIDSSLLQFDQGGNLIYPDKSGRRLKFDSPVFEEFFIAADLKEAAWRSDGRRLCAISNNDIFWVDLQPMRRVAAERRAGPASVAWLADKGIWAVPTSTKYVEYQVQSAGETAGFERVQETWEPEAAEEQSGARLRMVRDETDRLAIYFGRRLYFSNQGGEPPEATTFDVNPNRLIFDDLHWDHRGRMLTALFVQPGGEGVVAHSWATGGTASPVGNIQIDARRVVPAQDGKSLIARGEGAGIRKIDAASGAARVLDDSAAAKQDAPLMVSPGGTWIAAASDFGNIRLLRGGGEHYADLRARRPARARSIVWHESEEQFAVVTDDGYLRIWHLGPWLEWIEKHGVAD